MAFDKSMVIFFLIFMAFCRRVSMAAAYQVGDSSGWTSMGQVDYKEWAASKNLHVGDTLVFNYNNQFHNVNYNNQFHNVNYNNQFHNVKQVTQQGFEACNATSPIATYTNGYDTVTLGKLGHFYFMCGYPGHCQAGQQIDILVSSPTSSLSPSPSIVQTTEPSAASSLYFSYNLYWTLGVLLASCLSGFAY